METVTEPAVLMEDLVLDTSGLTQLSAAAAKLVSGPTKASSAAQYERYQNRCTEWFRTNQKLWNESNLCDYFLTLKDKYLASLWSIFSCLNSYSKSKYVSPLH